MISSQELDRDAKAVETGLVLKTIPDEITHDAGHLSIRWKDGRACSFPLLALRKACPCANCRGGHELTARRTTEHITQIQLVSWKKVGRYAIQITWSDNHDLGIYTYDYLREACENGTDYMPPDRR